MSDRRTPSLGSRASTVGSPPDASSSALVERIMRTVDAAPRPSVTGSLMASIRDRSLADAVGSVVVAAHLVVRGHGVPTRIRAQALVLMAIVAMLTGTGATLAASTVITIGTPIIDSSQHRPDGASSVSASSIPALDDDTDPVVVSEGEIVSPARTTTVAPHRPARIRHESPAATNESTAVDTDDDTDSDADDEADDDRPDDRPHASEAGDDHDDGSHTTDASEPPGDHHDADEPGSDADDDDHADDDHESDGPDGGGDDDHADRGDDDGPDAGAG